ncbi:MAG: HAMP domain-containing protein [Blastocatellia bacterium]|nr:HAMP domain-containing protein [Chloracidobacterium sp.]MBL8184638.1 HAMP domain-containing protein [Blastocatellia bacterium]HRJ87283.1 ATP-binding protein [Pyrinomonadaceae bacterium]HRK52206.1 ATP-binding protein [Pyrinomonadaceae bacterium]
MNFLNTFRGRLLLILALMLIGTIGVQYYLNLVSQEENNELRDEQARAIVSGFALGAYTLTGEDRVKDLVDQPGQRWLDDQCRARIKDIIIIDNEWRISDSLNEDYLPTTGDGGEVVYRRLSELTDLPPLMEGGRLGDDLARFPNRKSAANKNADDEAHVVPIETSKGRWYVMVILRNDRSEAARRAAQPLIVTLAVLSISTLVTFLLVWRFTRPIANLSAAARRVAEGDLTFRVPDENRSDEMGRLAQRFNEMTSELEKSKELEEQLQQAEKSAVIGRLGSAIAHEIRNPLNYINLTLDHLRSKFAPDDKDRQATFKKLISQIKDEVARINSQISDFLNYSRPANANLRPVNARQVVENSLRIIEGQAEENHIKIAVIEHENVPEILGDPEFLRSVFTNLFINAVQSMGADGGHLTVKIGRDDGGQYVRFEVTDTGNGIPAENLSKIFEPYYSTKETGTGLGLAIVQKIIDVHNGTIAVESIEGEGTKFSVRLPTADGRG